VIAISSYLKLGSENIQGGSIKHDTELDDLKVDSVGTTRRTRNPDFKSLRFSENFK